MMILSPVICGILSNVRRISFSKRCMLWTYTCRSNPCTNGFIQNIGSRRIAHNILSNPQMLITKERKYQQKDGLSHDERLIYFHSEQNLWSIMYYCVQLMQVFVIVAVIYGYIYFEPPLERNEEIIMKRTNPKIQDRYEFVVMGVLSMLLLYLLSRGLACTVSRIYSNSKKCEYTVIFLKRFSERRITIPYDCFTPKYSIRLFLGREIIFTANKHTFIIFSEYFSSPDVARRVLTNRMKKTIK